MNREQDLIKASLLPERANVPSPLPPLETFERVIVARAISLRRAIKIRINDRARVATFLSTTMFRR